MTIWRLVAGAVLLAATAGMGQAETLNYYYVSGPSYVANQKDPAARTLFNAGWLTVDLSRLPDGEGIENRTIRYDSEDYLGEYYDPASEAIDYYFVADELFSSRNFDITFDENRMIKSWAFNNNVFPSTDKAFYTITNNYDRQIDSWYYGSAADYRARTVLDSLGYKEGTGAYSDLYCGSWAGRAAGCGIIGEPADAWAAYYMAEGGMWFTDPIGFALQVEAVTKAALANPPVSYHDIAAVPVPAPLGLLAVGIAALGLVRPRRGKRLISG